MKTTKQLKPIFNELWLGHAEAVGAYNELHHLAHNLRAVGMSELAEKIDSIKKGFDAQHDAELKLFREIAPLYEG